VYSRNTENRGDGYGMNGMAMAARGATSLSSKKRDCAAKRRARTGCAKLPKRDVGRRSRLGLDYFVADGVANQFGHRVTIQPAHDIGAVRFSGFHAQAQRDRDFLAALTFG
jgi:hypothetical protein